MPSMDEIIDRVDELRGKSIEVEELGSENFIDQGNKMNGFKRAMNVLSSPDYPL
jgi:hypothetical protein